MSYDRFVALVSDVCVELGIPDPDGVIERGYLEVKDFEVRTNNFENDPGALYLGFNFGVVLAGRTLRIFRLMLEANLTVYAQDQAQLGMDAETGSVQLIVRIPMSDGVDGPWLVETLNHYFEHGRYWKDTLAGSSDEMFEGICAGDYGWIRA